LSAARSFPFSWPFRDLSQQRKEKGENAGHGEQKKGERVTIASRCSGRGEGEGGIGEVVASPWAQTTSRGFFSPKKEKKEKKRPRTARRGCGGPRYRKKKKKERKREKGELTSARFGNRAGWVLSRQKMCRGGGKRKRSREGRKGSAADGRAHRAELDRREEKGREQERFIKEMESRRKKKKEKGRKGGWRSIRE